MQSDKNKKKHSMIFAVLCTALIPVCLYILRCYTELVSKSLHYIGGQFPVITNNVLLIGLFPVGIFFIIIYVTAYTDVYTPVTKITNSLFKKKCWVRYTINFSIILFLLYNLFAVYVYIKHIGGNPLLSLEEFLNWRK